MAEYNQQFDSKQEWLRDGRAWLTRRGAGVTAICFDTRGRPVVTCNDFSRATQDGALPVRYLWPNQVARLALGFDFAQIVAADQPELDRR